MATDTPRNGDTTLTSLRPGASARITDIQGPRNLRHRLLGLGLHPGGRLTLLQRRGHGLVVAIGASRVALDEQIAAMLLVEEGV